MYKYQKLILHLSIGSVIALWILCFLGLVFDQLFVTDLPKAPLAGVAIVFRVHEHFAVVIVDFREIGTVVVARIPRFLAELDVSHVAL